MKINGLNVTYLDKFHHFLGGGRRLELQRVELAIHEVEASIDGPPVGGAQDLLFGGGPLAPPVVEGFQETLLRVSGQSITHCYYLITCKLFIIITYKLLISEQKLFIYL